MPGVGAPASESADIGIADWVAAVVAEIDAHRARSSSSGTAAAATSRGAPRTPDPTVWPASSSSTPRSPPDGGTISEFDVVDGVIPFPGWDFFDEDDVADLDDETRARTAPHRDERARARCRPTRSRCTTSAASACR